MIGACFYCIDTATLALIHLYSRSRKIKCLQSTPTSRCDACKEAGLECSFRDRARYFEERGRTGRTPPPRPGSSTQVHGAHHHHQQSQPQSGGSVQPYPTSGGNHLGITHGPQHSQGMQLYTPTTLFDPTWPQFPNSELMPMLISSLFQQMGNSIPTMTFEDTMAKFSNQSLPPVLANSIAAAAVEYDLFFYNSSLLFYLD